MTTRPSPKDINNNVLNDFSAAKVSKYYYNVKNTSNISTISRQSKQAYDVSVLPRGRNRLRAFVLRVETRGVVNNDGTPLEFSRDRPLPQVVVRARIPEMHAYAPIPGKFGDEGPGFHQAIINNFYPLFTAVDNSVPTPRCGDVIWVDFGNRANLSDGIYIGPVDYHSVLNDGSDGSGTNPSEDFDKKKRAGGAALSTSTSGVITPGTGDAVKNAINEWEFWRGATEVDIQENSGLQDRLITYWKATGRRDPLSKEMVIRTVNNQPNEMSPWSATFITYIMRDDPTFLPLCRGNRFACANHLTYMRGAAVNRFKSTDGWMTFTIAEWRASGMPIKPGMLLCNKSHHCDLVVDEKTKIGGNAFNATGSGFRRGADTVGRQRLKVSSMGWVMAKIAPGARHPPRGSDFDLMGSRLGPWGRPCKQNLGRRCKTVREVLQAEGANQ
jgi:hypothetical protein